MISRSFDALRSGIQLLVTHHEEHSKTRRLEDTLNSDKGVRVVHASALGKCPVALYYSLTGNDTHRGIPASKIPFMEDGFVHEDVTSRYSHKGVMDDLIVRDNVKIPPQIFDSHSLMIIGEADIVIGDGAHITYEVVEHKAVYHATFERYIAAPETIPRKYIVQLAAYIVALNATDGGLLVIKDRERSTFFPDIREEHPHPAMRLTYDEAMTLYSEAVSMVKSIIDGTVPGIPPIMIEDCVFCPFKSTCYSDVRGALPDTNEKKSLDLTTDVSGEAENIRKAIEERAELDRDIKRLTALRTIIDGNVKDFLHTEGIKRILTSSGNVSVVTRSGSVTPTVKGRAAIKVLIENGTVETKRGAPSIFLRYSPGGIK